VLSGTAPFLLTKFITMPTATPHFHNVTVSTTASVYFDGKCVSHGITLADGTKKSVGVVLPSIPAHLKSWNARLGAVNTNWRERTLG
jgi:hypothetical protein